MSDQQEPKNEKEEKNENEKKEEKVEDEESSSREEDRKEIYKAIQDLPKSDANDNIKSKIVLMTDVYLDFKKIERENYGKEYDIIHDKYEKKYIEIYEKIEDVVKSKEKIEMSPEEKEKYGIVDDENENREIEDYWEKVIINSRYFTINDQDKSIVKYLNNVKMTKLGVNDFKVDFIFKENEFFTPEILSKTYLYDKDAILKSSVGTEINWKSDEKNPTSKKVRKKVKKGKKYIYENRVEKVDSFFSFFSQTKDMTFLGDETTFFKEDLFTNQLEYYLDIISKTKHENNSEEDDLDEDYGQKNEKKEEEKKEECKQQ